MDIWRNGYTYYNSPTNAAITGSLRDPVTLSRPTPRDFLQEAIINGHRNQMAVFGWFQYGLAGGYGNSATATKVTTWANTNGYLLKNSTGGVVANPDANGNGFIFMNPLQPAVQTYITNLLLDAVNNYHLDGIQLDDHLAWPVAMGYDSYTTLIYQQEHGGASPPTNPSNSAWIKWRADKLTSFLTTLSKTLRAANPNLILSVSPGSWISCYNNYCADWPTWQKNGLFDEYMPQCYTSVLGDFNSAWTIQQQQMPTAKGDLAAGIAINTTPTPDWATVIKPELDASRGSAGFAGQALWFVDGVFANEPNLTGYYNVATNGPASRPDLTVPAPVVGTLSGSDFLFNITKPGIYDLITFNGSAWTLAQSNIYINGNSYTATLSGITGAQLLLNMPFYVVPEPAALTFLPLLSLCLSRRRN
jgi:uncharacterized lipoprotein YddW (UPF0748 family)